jgi:hypothetical protein
VTISARHYRVLIAAAVPIAWMIFANPGRAEPPARDSTTRVRVPDVRPAPPDLTPPIGDLLAIGEPLAITRNPFAYAPRRESPIPGPSPASVAPPPEAPPEGPSSVALSLIGVATASLADGRIERTAIVAGPAGALYMVREADAVTPRYRVDAILPDSVVLVYAATGAPLQLIMR